MLQTQTATLNGNFSQFFERWFPGLPIANDENLRFTAKALEDLAQARRAARLIASYGTDKLTYLSQYISENIYLLRYSISPRRKGAHSK